MFEEVLLKIKTIESEYNRLMDRLENANNELTKIQNMAWSVASVDSKVSATQLVKECMNIVLH